MTSSTPQKKSPIIAIKAAIKRMPDFLVDGIAYWGGLIAAIFGTFAAIAGVFAYFAQGESSERKEAKLTEELRQSKVEIAKANEGAANANREAAKALEKAAEFNEIAERERLARLELEEKLRPRSFSGEELQNMVDLLKPFSGRRIDLIKVGDGYEVARFCDQIKLFLTTAGWEVGGPWGTLGNASGTGIAICVSQDVEPSDKTDIAAGTLLDAIKATKHIVGVAAKFDRSEDIILMGPPWDKSNVAQIRLFIAEKP